MPTATATSIGVMGPDEYHEVVDDNAYTNVMARWNLRRGAELLDRIGRRPHEAAETWRALADGLVDGWDPERGLYEQFAGYFDLEPLLMSQVGPPPLAVDVLLGRERVAGSQLIKQADVLMLHHLVPERGGRRVARPVPRLLRASHRPWQLALARRSRRRCSPAPGSPSGPSSCSAWRPGSTSTI